MKYKALMLDVDGTTIPNKMQALPSPAVTTAIAEASKYIHVGLATSRSLHVAKPVLDHLQLSGPSVLHNGAYIIDLPSKSILVEHVIPAPTVQSVCHILQRAQVPFYLQDDAKNMQFHEYGSEKIFAIVADPLDEEMTKQLMQECATDETIAVHKGLSWEKGKLWIAISPSQATKQHGISEIARILNIATHEIIGVGDGHNDFPLLMACGLKVAMGNAVDDIKAIADYIAPSVEEDGVAEVIRRFILNQ